MNPRNEFTIHAPIVRVWEVLLDVGRVASCLPSAAIESSDGDEHVDAMMIKLGTITSGYAGPFASRSPTKRSGVR